MSPPSLAVFAEMFAAVPSAECQISRLGCRGDQPTLGRVLVRIYHLIVHIAVSRGCRSMSQRIGDYYFVIIFRKIAKKFFPRWVKGLHPFFSQNLDQCKNDNEKARH